MLDLRRQALTYMGLYSCILWHNFSWWFMFLSGTLEKYVWLICIRLAKCTLVARNKITCICDTVFEWYRKSPFPSRMSICIVCVTSSHYYIKVSQDRDKVYQMYKQQEEKWRKKVIELQVHKYCITIHSPTIYHTHLVSLQVSDLRWFNGMK